LNKSCYYSSVPKPNSRPYKSPLRQQQAMDTSRRIVEAARQLLTSEGYGGMTVEEIARRAKVSAQTVYAIFKSKKGILIALLDQSMFGPDYDEVVRQTLSTSDPKTRLQRAASVARQLRGAQSAAFDLMRGAGVVAPELAKLEQQRERLRYSHVKGVITLLRDSGKLRPELTGTTARDIFWMLTGGDVYRMLVRERGWTPQKYQEWLADTLVRSLLTQANARPVRHRAATRDSSARAPSSSFPGRTT
jgi:AcrR family transcriptional regulator